MDIITAPVPMEPLDLEALKSRLEELAAPVRAKGVTVETVASVSLPVDEILDLA